MTRFWWLGRVDYRTAHALQEQLLEARIADEIPDTVLLLEHDPVITVGRRRGAQANVLAATDVPVVPVERGGDVTWHGPGQLVAYPIIALRGPRADLHLHLHSLEDAVISLLAEQGLDAGRDPRNTGVWLAARGEAPRKVCSIGIACRKWVTWHGLALNIDPDLEEFARIRPCGFDAQVMTRVVDHLDDERPIQQWAAALVPHLCRSLGLPEGALESRPGPTVR